jgi:sec-independent protein translocase protein TatA
MLGSLGVPEVIVIFVIALIIFGPRKLPELARSLGKGIAEFKRATNDLQSSLEDEIRTEEPRLDAPKATASTDTASHAENSAPATKAG